MRLPRALAASLFATVLAGMSLAAAPTPQPASDVSDKALLARLPGFAEGFAEVNGVRLHYVEGGEGDPVILLPGWPETWWEFHKIMPGLAKGHRVIVLDLRGMGASSKPVDGYDKRTMAGDVAGLMAKLGLAEADIVGHDIGSQVAFAFAANHPDLTRRLVMIDVAHPDAQLARWTLLPGVGTFGDKVGDGSQAYAWWFAFHQVKGLPEDLMADGRIRLEQDWFFHYLTVDERAIDAFDRDVYAAAYGSREAIRAGDAWYQAFPQDIVDDGTYAKLRMPVLAIGGPGYGWLKATLAEKASNLRVVKVDNSGHFIPEEQPQVLLDLLTDFLK